MTQPADGATAVAAPASESPKVEAAPAPSTTEKDWLAPESYEWSEDEESSPKPTSTDPPAAEAPATTTATAPIAESPKETTPDDVATSLERLASGELTDEQARKLLENPKVQEAVETRANNLLGNRLQKALAERDESAKAEATWETATRAYNEHMALAQSDPAKFAARMADVDNPKGWPAFIQNYKNTEQARAATRTTPDVESIRANTREEALQIFNVDGAKAFAATLKSELPFYNDLSPELRRDLESASQQTDEPWAKEWVGRLAKDVAKMTDQKVAAARQAAKNEALSEGGDGTGEVVMPQGKPSDRFDVDAILNRYMDFGEDIEAGGVSFADYQKAMRARGLEE